MSTKGRRGTSRAASDEVQRSGVWTVGVAADTGRLGIKPNYSARTSIPKVLTDTARAFVMNGGTLEVLSYAQLPKLKTEDMEPQDGFLPSSNEVEGEAELRKLPYWVPDWRPRYFTFLLCDWKSQSRRRTDSTVYTLREKIDGGNHLYRVPLCPRTARISGRHD